MGSAARVERWRRALAAAAGLLCVHAGCAGREDCNSAAVGMVAGSRGWRRWAGEVLLLQRALTGSAAFLLYRDSVFCRGIQTGDGKGEGGGVLQPLRGHHCPLGWVPPGMGAPRKFTRRVTSRGWVHLGGGICTACTAMMTASCSQCGDDMQLTTVQRLMVEREPAGAACEFGQADSL